MLNLIKSLDYGSPNFPQSLRKDTGGHRFPRVWVMGNLNILGYHLLGLFCSTRCPGEVILKMYDLSRALRDAGVPVIGGFHSPMEKECLDLLLRGTQPVVVCPARSITTMRVPRVWRKAITDGRLLILSPFGDNHKRISASLAEERNHFVALLGNEFFVHYAAPGSKTERLCQDMLRAGKRVYTFESEREGNVVKAGAVPIALNQLVSTMVARQG